MERWKITDDHGLTTRKLRKKERKIKDASFHEQVTRRPIDYGRLSRERSGSDVEPPSSIPVYLRLVVQMKAD